MEFLKDDSSANSKITGEATPETSDASDLQQRLLELQQNRAEQYGALKAQIDADTKMRKIHSDICIESIFNEKKLPKETLMDLVANIYGRVGITVVFLDQDMRKTIKDNMIAIIEKHPAPIEEINEALSVTLSGINLTFSENKKLEDTSQLDKLIYRIQNPPNKTHPVSTVLASLIAKKQNSPS